MDLPSNDQLVASAANFLVQGQEHEAAITLLLCEAEAEITNFATVDIYLSGPRQIFALLRHGEDETPLLDAIRRAFNAVLKQHMVEYIHINAQLLHDLDPAWRDELLEMAEGRGTHNQGVEIPDRRIIIWKNLRFRSEAERRIAEALDATNALFLPNCLARLSSGTSRITKEADFLIAYEGKWGILEVDGPFHTKAATDHERDRLFRQYHIRVIERFEAQACYNDAAQVVREFLALLAKNG